MPTPKMLIKKHFPKVRRIVDSTRTLEVTVTPADVAAGNPLDPEGCALVKACVRQKIADAAIIGISYSYLIKGDTAVRYHTSTAVSREITSFDRHKDFAAGMNYKLSKISKSNRLGRRLEYADNSDRPRKTTREFPLQVHRTANVRVMRGLSPTVNKP